MSYAYIKDEKIIGSGVCEVSGNGITCIEITEEIRADIKKYMYSNGEIIINPNYEQEEYKKRRKEEILIRLNEIDLKSIRALRANDTEYIEIYENEAANLREELRGLNDNN